MGNRVTTKQPQPNEGISAAESREDWAGSNIGSGRAKIVRDATPSNPWTPDRDSAERSIKGKGLNDQTMNQSLRESNGQGVDLTGDTDPDGEFDNQDLRGICGRGTD